jgi:pimeloyl-ACP methyl ester carboxylesterase
MGRTIFMIHGMWGQAGLWERYAEFFGSRGWECVAPTLRHHDISPGEPPPPGLGATSLLDYAADLEARLRRLDEPPVIMGHSMGGLLAQMLAARGLGRAGVFLTPAWPAGIGLVLPWSVIKSFRGALLRWGFWRKPHRPGFAEARYAMLHLLPPEEARAAHAAMLWESGRAATEIGLWWLDGRSASRVEPAGMTCPLLVVAGGRDRITPASLVRRVAAAYGAHYEVFPEHSHWVLAEPGWQEVAGRVADWLEKHAGGA